MSSSPEKSAVAELKAKTPFKTRIPLLAGNWKMYKTVAESVSLVRELRDSLCGISDREILICPPLPCLLSVWEILKGSNIKLGAQNLHWEQEGAFTGEVSGAMLRSSGCSFVIVGHSERRQFFSETDETVNKKVKAALRNQLIPIVCIGETLEEREKGSAFQVVERQIKNGLSGLKEQELSNLVIAYEPVWAIGTGRTATPQQAEEMHAFIRKILARASGEILAQRIRVLYGGSVKPENIDGLMAQPDIDGGLVGGSSLKASEFVRIVQYQKS